MATGVDAKLLKSTKFPPEFNQKVDMQKVNLQVMKKCANYPFASSGVSAKVLTLPCSTGGLQERYPRFLVAKMMSSQSSASTSLRAPDT